MSEEIKQMSTEYRPEKIEDFVCSPELHTRLKNMIENRKFNRVTLITGISGSGKTTLARLLAKEINGTLKGVVEMNMADTKGINDIRNLADMIKYKPANSKYLVLILDEVQALTGQGASAMLKPLEDLPKHCVAFLCTDQPGKLLPTIQNRCTPINLEVPTPDMIAKHLKKICKKEGVELSKEIRFEIGEACDGQIRKAIQILQSILSMIDKKGKAKNIEKAIEQARSTVLKADEDLNVVKFLISLYTKNNASVMEIITNVQDFNAFINKSLEIHRFMFDNLLKKSGKQVNGYYFSPNRNKVWTVVTDKCKNTWQLDSIKIHNLLVDLKLSMSSYAVKEYHLFMAKVNNWIISNSKKEK